MIATKNRPNQISRLLKMMVPQLGEFDRIIVSDASDIRNNYGFTSDGRVLITWNNSIGISTNRNIALEYCKTLEFDFWTFLDDDIEISENYIESVKNICINLPKETAFTGTLNGEWPKLPDWLGYYRKKPLAHSKRQLMPSSVGTWIPQNQNIQFKYRSNFAYGYDEIEIADFLYLNNINLIYVPGLNINHDNSEISTGYSISDYDLNYARIAINIESKRRRNKSKNSIFVFKMRCYIHLLLRGNMMSEIQTLKYFKSIFIYEKQGLSNE